MVYEADLYRLRGVLAKDGQLRGPVGREQAGNVPPQRAIQPLKLALPVSRVFEENPAREREVRVAACAVLGRLAGFQEVRHLAVRPLFLKHQPEVVQTEV